jgi:hypothetical protein
MSARVRRARAVRRVGLPRAGDGPRRDRNNRTSVEWYPFLPTRIIGMIFYENGSAVMISVSRNDSYVPSPLSRGGPAARRCRCRAHPTG